MVSSGEGYNRVYNSLWQVLYLTAFDKASFSMVAKKPLKMDWSQDFQIKVLFLGKASKVSRHWFQENCRHCWKKFFHFFHVSISTSKIDRGWDTLRKKFSKPTRWIESGSIECRFRCNPKWDLLIHQQSSLNFYSTHLPIYPSILSIYPFTNLSILIQSESLYS